MGTTRRVKVDLLNFYMAGDDGPHNVGNLIKLTVGEHVLEVEGAEQAVALMNILDDLGVEYDKEIHNENACEAWEEYYQSY